MAHEYQKSKVYRWEDAHIPKGKRIALADAQAFVNIVWAAEGLKYPPIVHELPKQTRRWAGKGNREGVWLPHTGSNEHTILHELAHTLTMTIHGLVDDDTAHGPDFVGMFMQLVAKHMGLSIFALWYTAQQAGIEFEKFPKPKITSL